MMARRIYLLQPKTFQGLHFPMQLDGKMRAPHPEGIFGRACTPCINMTNTLSQPAWWATRTSTCHLPFAGAVALNRKGCFLPTFHALCPPDNSAVSSPLSRLFDARAQTSDIHSYSSRSTRQKLWATKT